MYSKVNDRGHFGIPKIIFGETGIQDVVIDIEGNYGMTQNAMAIEVNNMDEAELIKKALLSEKFKDLLKSCLWSSYRIEWSMFIDFKEDFWKEFI
jgi:hypothetical protein